MLWPYHRVQSIFDGGRRSTQVVLARGDTMSAETAHISVKESWVGEPLEDATVITSACVNEVPVLFLSKYPDGSEGNWQSVLERSRQL